MGRRSRRRTYGISWEQGMRAARHQAFRHFGQKHYRLLIFWPYIGPIVTAAVCVVGLAVAWLLLPHLLLGVAAAILAAGSVIGYLGWQATWTATQARLKARASGGSARGGFGWAVGTFAVLMATGAWLSLGSPWS